MFRPMRGAAAALLTAGLVAGAAWADVSEFLGNWLNSEAGQGGFVGNLIGSGSDDSEIARIVTTPAGANAVRIHLYGRCTPECDWGAQLGHNHMAGPNSNELRSITADFNTGTSIKHLTLRKGPGNSLRFEVVTDFTARNGKHDYEASGSLRFVQPSAVPPLAVVAPPAMAAVPATTAPAAVDITEDCEKINPETVFIAPANRGWTVRDYNHVIVDYGPDKAGAVKASRVLGYYRFDEHCLIARPKPKMVYWRIAGQMPRESMSGEDCVEVHPQAVAAKAGKVMDGDRVVVDFQDDSRAAAQAAAVIRGYRLNRQCFVGRPSEKMVYWLSK